ncbi:hypothetical protein UY286_10515 [Paenibacillus polymyxa]|uniref:hypothetical protein n=1 Tax=Paenibacillus polymyxa TaxID=1406 RepID=UPI002AB443B4|nr:hypothetical protein [Paenibacillus polymyxa]MDY7991436.1 hypothetical protein [Paenibacillus polymyxa]MDY8117877.1 hypothetical protein [Paenibacillus polymyxa]
MRTCKTTARVKMTITPLLPDDSGSAALFVFYWRFVCCGTSTVISNSSSALTRRTE